MFAANDDSGDSGDSHDEEEDEINGQMIIEGSDVRDDEPMVVNND